MLLRIVLIVTLFALFQRPARADDAARNVEDVKAVLASYKHSLESLDLQGVEALFAPTNEVVESGKVEGSCADYRDHHIGCTSSPFLFRLHRARPARGIGRPGDGDLSLHDRARGQAGADRAPGRRDERADPSRGVLENRVHAQFLARAQARELSGAILLGLAASP